MKRARMNWNIALGLGFSLLASLATACSSADRTGFAPAATEPGASEDMPAPQADRTGCAQDQYTETLPPNTSLKGLTFSASEAEAYLVAALEKRYPIGKELVTGGVSRSKNEPNGSCVEQFLTDTSSASAVLRQASTIVHECGHFYDLAEGGGTESAYVIIPSTLSFTCKDGDTTSRHGKTFARSLIKKDAYYSNRKACAAGTARAGCDMYASTYLNGDPEDDTFESGDQGYSLLLEEATQYVNSLASALAFKEQYDGTKASERDGILTFLWYLERYIAMAHAEYPEAYELLSGDPCWRQATLTVWDRGWFYLRATEGMANLGIEDAKIAPLVNERALLAEIDALRALECK